MNLYDIATEYREAHEKLADLDLDQQTIEDTLEGMGGDLEVKAVNVVGFTRSEELYTRQVEREQRQERETQRLREYITEQERRLARADLPRMIEFIARAMGERPDLIARLPEEEIVSQLERQLKDMERNEEVRQRKTDALNRAKILREQIKKLGGEPVR